MSLACPRVFTGLLVLALAVAIGGCGSGTEPTESPESPKPSLATACSDDYCGPTDGTVHDATGNGTIPTVAGDTSPGAAGIWLGNKVSRGWCYANYNTLVNDTDDDWLDDECEFQLAKAFAPVFAISPSDGCPGGEPYWAAKYYPNGFAGWGDFVRIAYMPAYYRDCGATPHAGDSEFIMVGVQFNPNTRHWESREAYFSAHAGTPNNASDYIRDRNDLEYPVRSLAYPRIWIARNKHGNYRTRSECNNRAIFDDNCSDNQNVGRLRIYRSRNVGSRFVDKFPNGVISQNPQWSLSGKKEYFYTSVRFGGWQPAATGASPYRSFLGYYVFECYDYTYTFTGGTCWGGPGPSPPTSTILTGVIDGPTSVTAYQSYTWTSFVTGGTLPYRAEWWRKYASASTATLLSTSTGNFSTAGSLTRTVDRCENFTLTIKIWSANNQFWSDDHPVTIGTCPPPPLSASISGPSGISVKGTYTFSAVLTNFTGPSYTWSERYCDDWAGTACDPWRALINMGASFQRVLGPMCGVRQEDNFQLRLVVRNSDGRTVTTTKKTALCNSLQ
jgi:hypothetical protein